MSIFNKVKKIFSKNLNTNTSKVMYCSHCGSSDVEFSRDAMFCKNCNLGDDRVEIIENCYVCGREIRLNTKYYNINDTKKICCKDCSDINSEMTKTEEEIFFDLFKNCKVCGKQYKVNNKVKEDVCYSCQLETIKTSSQDYKNDFKKEVSHCENCGVEFYVKNSDKICDTCKKFS